MIAATSTMQRLPVGQSTELAMQLASDCLEGCYSDYLFFYDDHVQISTLSYYYQYYLVIGSIEQTASGFSCSGCHVFDIRVRDDISVARDSFTLSGSDAAGAISGTIDGAWKQVHSLSQSMTVYEKQSLSVDTSSGAIFYSSSPWCPHLVEGGERYAFAGLLFGAVAAAIIAFCSIWRRTS